MSSIRYNSTRFFNCPAACGTFPRAFILKDLDSVFLTKDGLYIPNGIQKSDFRRRQSTAIRRS